MQPHRRYIASIRESDATASLPALGGARLLSHAAEAHASGRANRYFGYFYFFFGSHASGGTRM
jgi:hypothetical protein